MMYSIERKSAIINLLETQGRVDVGELAKRFDASKETIRRDLRELETEGVVKRTHGGAVLTAETREVQEYPITVRGIQRFEEKNVICEKAASMIQDGDTVFIDNSSTTINLLKYIDKSIRATIVTNSLQLLIESTKVNNQNLQFICLGGLFRDSNFSVYGYFSLENAKSFYPTKAFLSCCGIDSRNILTDSSVYEVEIKRFMIERSSEVFLLADYTKFDKVGPVFLTDFSQIDHIVTDRQIDPAAVERLGGLQVNLIVT